MFKSIEQKSTVDAIHYQIRELILEKKIEPGSKLPTELELMEQLGVSRPALREAIRMLVGEGLLEVIHGRGTFVRDVSAASAIHSAVLRVLIDTCDLQEILDARMIIEPEIMAFAAERATSEGIAKLEKNIEDTQTALDQKKSVFEHTWEFHRLIGAVSGNTAMAQFSNVIYEMIKVVQKDLYNQHFDSKNELDEHKHLLDVIKSGDPEAARQAMRHHIDYVHDKTLEIMQRNRKD